jgi:hypothetical protein
MRKESIIGITIVSPFTRDPNAKTVIVTPGFAALVSPETANTVLKELNSEDS